MMNFDDTIFSAMDADVGIMSSDSILSSVQPGISFDATEMPLRPSMDLGNTDDRILGDISHSDATMDGIAVNGHEVVEHGEGAAFHLGKGMALGSKRDDILNEINQAQSDIDYYGKKVAQLTQEQAEGWIVDSSLSYNKGYLDSAESRLRDLQRELSYVDD